MPLADCPASLALLLKRAISIPVTNACASLQNKPPGRQRRGQMEQGCWWLRQQRVPTTACTPEPRACCPCSLLRTCWTPHASLPARQVTWDFARRTCRQSPKEGYLNYGNLDVTATSHARALDQGVGGSLCSRQFTQAGTRAYIVGVVTEGWKRLYQTLLRVTKLQHFCDSQLGHPENWSFCLSCSQVLSLVTLLRCENPLSGLTCHSSCTLGSQLA